MSEKHASRTSPNQMRPNATYPPNAVRVATEDVLQDDLANSVSEHEPVGVVGADDAFDGSIDRILIDPSELVFRHVVLPIQTCV